MKEGRRRKEGERRKMKEGRKVATTPYFSPGRATGVSRVSTLFSTTAPVFCLRVPPELCARPINTIPPNTITSNNCARHRAQVHENNRAGAHPEEAVGAHETVAELHSGPGAGRVSGRGGVCVCGCVYVVELYF